MSSSIATSVVRAHERVIDATVLERGFLETYTGIWKWICVGLAFWRFGVPESVPAKLATRYALRITSKSVARRMNVSCALRAARMFSSFSRPAHPPAVTVPV